MDDRNPQVSLGDSLKKPEIFQRINFQPVVPDFTVSCLLRLDNKSTEDDILTYTTELRLTRKKLKATNNGYVVNCEASFNGTADVDQHVTLSTVTLPYGIWVSFNGGDKSSLKESPSGLWKSNQFLTNFPASVRVSTDFQG